MLVASERAGLDFSTASTISSGEVTVPQKLGYPAFIGYKIN